MTVIIVQQGRSPDILITEFFSYFKIEGSILGVLKIVETIIELIDRRFCSKAAEHTAHPSGTECCSPAESQKPDNKI